MVGLWRAVRYARDGQLLLAVAVTGCVTVAASPAAWQHQLLWVLLTAVGRVGARRAGRLVWPVIVVAVTVLPSKVLLPNLPPLRDNAPALATLSAACIIPFVSRLSPHFDSPRAARYVAPGPARWSWVPLLPHWRKTLSRPNLLLELLLICIGYAVYQHIRLGAEGNRWAAEEHGAQIHSIVMLLHIDIESWFNHLVARHVWLEVLFTFHYQDFHFMVPLVILAILYLRNPAASAGHAVSWVLPRCWPCWGTGSIPWRRRA